VAAALLWVAFPPFSAAETQPVPELTWGAAPALSAAEQAQREGRYQEAIRLYAEAAMDHSQQGSALLGRGTAYELVNQPQKAIEDYRRAIEVDRENYRAMENLAGIYERGGKHISEAIALYRHALKLDPRPEWKENLAAWIAMLETRLQPQTSSAVGCWRLANEKARAGELREAEVLYAKAISLDPEMFAAYYRRGLLRRNVGDLSGAVSDFESTVRISPTFRGGFVQKGLTHEQMGEREQARNDFEQAAKFDPRDPEALYHLARSLDSAEDLGRAADLYQRALCLKPGAELRKLIMDKIAGLPATVKSDTKRGSTPPNNLKQLW